MKLLFDENLSPRLVAELSTEFPGSVHVHDVGLGTTADSAVWDYARDNGFFNTLQAARGPRFRILLGSRRHAGRARGRRVPGA